MLTSIMDNGFNSADRFCAADEIARRRILVMDGSMGSLIQGLGLTEEDFRGDRFTSHPVPLKGCNDILCLTRPDLIASIHTRYLAAGADITKTCSFSANAISLADYGLSHLAYEINKAAAAIARGVILSASHGDASAVSTLVAGSIGATSKSASLSPDVNDPAARSITWDELEAVYYDQMHGLLDGGADVLLLETCFDTLNAKAAIAALLRLREERKEKIPVMISATISGPSGRLLSGQTVEAFCASVSHAAPWSVGLNCSFGADDLLPHLRRVAACIPCLCSVHPNAGLPNLSGGYDDTPSVMADALEAYMREGLLNIAGGCCGTTPDHIAAIAEKSAAYTPRPLPQNLVPRLLLSGLELVDTATDDTPFLPIGERTNVAGSRKFLRLIKESDFAEAAEIARETVAHGAKVIDVCMDDALIDAESSMTAFLNHALSDPLIAAVPVMVDSSKWGVIEAGLKCLQGKPLVNSISLKEGEAAFLNKARSARRHGAALVVMLFDEEGQAADYEHKIAVARRSYDLLVKDGFPPEDIVFDPNVLAIATGIPEHDSYALAFIRASYWIRENCPYANISGGVSNLSFSFRGNDTVRNALHSVFLKHAREAGLTMAIVNPASLVPYEDLSPDLRAAAEDLVLCRDPTASERLLALALENSGGAPSGKNTSDKNTTAWRETTDEAGRVTYAVINGIDTYIESDVRDLLEKKRVEKPEAANHADASEAALSIVEGPLMDAMNHIGVLFGEGKMFLPQVIRGARVMKKAVAVLEPFFKGASSSRTSKKIILATVKGDVHDIGKNIVGVVLGCSGYEVVDLGVMVPCETILEAAAREKADFIGLSGLITPSLDEMVHVAREMEKAQFTIPLLVGGAAASRAHTALFIAPEYSGAVVYSQDASEAAAVVRALSSNTEGPLFLENLKKSYDEAIAAEEAKRARKLRKTIPLEEARRNAFRAYAFVPPPARPGVHTFTDYPIEKVAPFINWNAFLSSWNMGNRCVAELETERETLLKDAQELLDRVMREKTLSLRAVVGFFKADTENEDVFVSWETGKYARFSFPRSLDIQKDGDPNPSLADFVACQCSIKRGDTTPIETDTANYVGLFVLSTGFGVQEAQETFSRQNDGYGSLLIASLANALAEAFSEEMHRLVREELWAYAPPPAAPSGIRPAFGYPIAPNQADIRTAFKLLDAEERIGIRLTDSYMMMPEASVCGLYIAHPGAYYFTP